MRISVKVSDIKPDLEKVFGGAMKLLYVVIRQEAIDALQAPQGVSLWPVATGLSKASFDAEIRPPVVSITNATTYAQYVEERGSPAGQTLVDHFESASLVDAVERVLQPYLDKQ